MSTEPQPSTSRANVETCVDYELDNMTLNIKDEEAEIAQLQLPPVADVKEEQPSTSAAEDERIAKIKFRCAACNMNEMVHYYGQAPPFAYGVEFVEDTYVMRDPFQPPPPRRKPKAEYFIALGAQCVRCERCVCRDAVCSFFYTRTYCLPCAKSSAESFPLEARSKLNKQLAIK